MTSFIVVSKDKKKREEYLKELYNKHEIDAFDVTIISIDNSVKQNTASIGIEDIKLMQKKISLKPIKSKTKAVILEEAELLTTEAQNALLKVLEEPPLHTLIILSTDTKENLLPTIISRCFLIDLGQDQIEIPEKEKKELEKFLEEFPKWGIGERLKKAEQLAKDKDKALVWIEKVILTAREKLIYCHSERSKESKEQDPSVSPQDDKLLFNLLKTFQALHTLLKTSNVNVRFALENSLLNPKP